MRTPLDLLLCRMQWVFCVFIFAHVKCSNYSCMNKTNAKCQIQTSPRTRRMKMNEWATKKGTYKCVHFADETGETFGRTVLPFALIIIVVKHQQLHVVRLLVSLLFSFHFILLSLLLQLLVASCCQCCCCCCWLSSFFPSSFACVHRCRYYSLFSFVHDFPWVNESVVVWVLAFFFFFFFYFFDCSFRCSQSVRIVIAVFLHIRFVPFDS